MNGERRQLLFGLIAFYRMSKMMNGLFSYTRCDSSTGCPAHRMQVDIDKNELSAPLALAVRKRRVIETPPSVGGRKNLMVRLSFVRLLAATCCCRVVRRIT